MSYDPSISQAAAQAAQSLGITASFNQDLNASQSSYVRFKDKYNKGKLISIFFPLLRRDISDRHVNVEKRIQCHI